MAAAKPTAATKSIFMSNHPYGTSSCHDLAGEYSEKHMHYTIMHFTHLPYLFELHLGTIAVPVD